MRLMMFRWAVGLCVGLLGVGCGPSRPGTPTWVKENPAVANDNLPRLRARAAYDRTVQVFTQPDCKGAVLVQVVAEEGLAEFEVPVADDSTLTLSLRAVDEEKGTSSDCSVPFVYTEDSRAPEAPSWAADNPVLTNASSPTLRASTEPGSRVAVHASADCSGPELATASADDSGVASLKVPMTANALHRLFLRTRDAAGNPSGCSEGFSLAHDGTPPSDVKFLGFTPASPANHNAPVLAGTSDPGTRVDLFAGSYCSSPALLTVALDAAGRFETTLSVKDDSSVSFSARATDAAGNASDCETTSTYVEDSTAPSAPTGLGLSYLSPNSVTSISVLGGAQTGMQVLLFTNAGCTGTPVASGTVGSFYSTFSVSTVVPENSATTFHLATQDPAGNRSTCAGPITYVHDDVVPELEGVKVSDGPGEDLRHQLVTHVAEAHWEGFTDASGIDLYEHYLSTVPLCSGSASSGLPSPRTTAQTTARLTGLALADNKSYFHCVRARDKAGNWSPYVASDGFRVDVSPPVVSGTTPTTGASGVDILGPVLFTFNEPVDASSLTPGSLTLEVNGSPVATTVACNAAATSCSFTPVRPLPYRETVRATLAATVKDPAGRVMTSPVSLTFTTRGRAWQAPREVRSTRPGLFPDVAVDGQGHALAVWVQGTASGAYRPFASRSSPHAGWEPARELDTVHLGDVERPAVAVNEAGFGVAVWELHGGARVDLYAAEYTPGPGWGEPRLLETRDEPVSTPRVGVDAEGNALVVWRQADGTAESLWAARLVKGSGWGVPLLLELDAGATTVPALALESSGRAVAAWLQPDTGGTVRVRASRFVPGSGWTPPEQAAASGEGLSVSAALSANGSALLLFRGPDASRGPSLFSTRFVPGEGWSAVAIRLGQAPPGAEELGLAMDRWGRAIAAWTEPGASPGYWNLFVSRFLPEEGWRTPVSVSALSASQPSVASDGQGNFHLVWVENVYGSDQVFAARYPEGATALSSAREIEPYHGGTSKRPRVRANGTGAAMTVWYRDNGGGFDSNLVYAAAYE